MELRRVSEMRPGDVNVDQAESLTGAAEGTIIYDADVFQVKSIGILLDGECAIRHLRGPEEARGKDRGVEFVNLGSRTGIEEVNSYLDERTVMMFAVRGHVFTLKHPDIAHEGEAFAIGVCGCARKHGYTCEAFEVRDAAGLDIYAVIADGRRARKKEMDHAQKRHYVAAGYRNGRDTRWRVRVRRGTQRDEHVCMASVEIYHLLRRANARAGMNRW